MESYGSFHLQFSKSGQVFDFYLHEKEGEESNAVFINEKKFFIQGDTSQISWLKSKIPELKQQQNISLDNLNGRLKDLEVENLDMPKIDKMNSFGIDLLQTKNLNVDSKSVGSWFKSECKLKHAIAEKYWELRVLKSPQNNHAEFLNLIRNNAKFDPESNLGNSVAESFLEAIQKMDKTAFIELFDLLPMGIAGMINHGEDLKAIPPSPMRDELKKRFTQDDLQGLHQYIKDSGFSGVVCLSDKKQNYTLSSENIKDSKTSFAMHSVGKVFTGILAMKMIKDGIITKKDLQEPIKLDPSILEILPESIKNHLTKENAPTFHQIMLHQGGLGDYLDKYENAIENALEHDQATPTINGPEDFIRNKFLDESILNLKEGEDHYSNIGILLVGLSLQHHYNTFHNTEISYQEILHKLIIEPAKLSSFSEKRPENACFNENHKVASHIVGGPAGGYWISAEDLLKFGEWTAQQCQDPQFNDLVNLYGREFSPSGGEISHGGEIHSATSFLGIFSPLNLNSAAKEEQEHPHSTKESNDFSNSITISILSNRPFHAAVLEGVIRDHILSK